MYMQIFNFKSAMIKSALAATVLLSASGAALAQQVINLTAAPANAALSDGSLVPMWGYSCGTAVTGSTAVCAALNPNALTNWTPVVITVPTGQDLQINLTNNLTFGTNSVPTSLVIVGQIGGGLGRGATSTASPDHSAGRSQTWPIASNTPVSGDQLPPLQGNRVQSFATEVTAISASTTATCSVATSATPVTGCATLTWTGMQPGTYLIESGTHPSIQGPIGLYGILVVTDATTGTAYPAAGSRAAVMYNADIPLLFSEIDPVQNTAVSAAVNTAGFSESAVFGTNNAPVNLVNVTGGGSGYASAPTVTFIGGGGSGAAATAIVDTAQYLPDGVTPNPTYGQVTGITVTSGGAGYTTTPKVSLSGGSGTGATAAAVLGAGTNANAIAYCSGGAAACYPPAVNYTALYYLINGRAFDTTNVAASLYPVNPLSSATCTPVSPATTCTPTVAGNVLVRLVNAGLRMHVPSIVGPTTGPATAPVPGMTLVAEDGNVLPGQARIQSEVFMAAGKTYDVSINVPATATTALPIYDRELSLSANATGRNAGMLAYIGINGANASVTSSGTSPKNAVANPDTYSLVPGQMLRVSDQSRGVIANDKGVYAVQLLAAPTNGAVTLFPNGTFDYFPASGSTATTDSFTYCANGTVTAGVCSSNISTTVALGPSTVADTGITCTVPTPVAPRTSTYTATTSTSMAVTTPGVLAFCKDGANLPLTVNTAAVTTTVGTVVADASGGFSVTGTGGGTATLTATLTFTVQNPKQQTATATVTVAFPAASNLAVTVLDGADHVTKITDYRWIIEEVRTFYVDPACTSNPLPVGCPTISGAPATSTASSPTINYGTNFHTSSMPVVAAGCTGKLSCEGGQTLGGSNVVCDVGNGVCRPDTGNGFAPTLPSSVVLDPSKRYYISILPGDAANPFIGGNASAPTNCTSPYNADGSLNTSCGHGMGGAPIAAACGPQSVSKAACINTSSTFPPVTVLTMPTPLKPATLSVFVYEDDYPLNGEHGSGGGVDVLAPQGPGLAGV